MTFSIYLQILLAVIIAVAFLAFWQGERDEKAAAGIVITANVCEVLVQQLAGVHGKQYGALVIDAVALVLFGVIAWRSVRSWPIWATSFQAVSTSVLLAGVVGMRVGQNAYAAAVNLADYGVLGSLGVGVFLAWREREALSGPKPIL